MPELQAVLEAFGPTWQHRITLFAAVVFLLGLLMERLWWMKDMRRDIAEIKADLPQMKENIERAQATADDAKSKAEMAEVSLSTISELVGRLNDAVLRLPDVIVSAMHAANGR